MVFIKIIKEQVPHVILKLKEILGINFFIPNILIPLGVLAIYSRSFEYFSFRFLPTGVNYIFATRLYDLVLILMAGFSLIFLVSYKKMPYTKIVLKYSIDKITSSKYLIILIPLTPVAQYILNNQDILSPLDSLQISVIFACIAVLYIIAVPMLFGIAGSTNLLIINGCAFVSTIYSMALLSQHYAWFEEGSFGIQLSFFILVFVLSWFLFTLKDRRVFNVIIVFFFVSNSTTQLLTQIVGTSDISNRVAENSLRSVIGTRIPAIKPNIYLLIYDSYVANETMMAYGIDNSSQEEYLTNQGFELYPHTYSIGSPTIESMSRVLNASTDFYGNPRRAVSGDGIVQNLFKEINYTTYGIFPFDFLFRGYGTSYDFSVPEKTSLINQVISSVLIGEFRFDQGFNDRSREKFVEAKWNIFEGVSNVPIFMVTYEYLPAHSQNSGACLPDEIERFNVRLTDANLVMRQDIDKITVNDPGAIIVVAGDHGPYLTKNCTYTSGKYDVSEITRLDIQDRFGSFLAIRWPSEDYGIYDDIVVFQDLFPAIFAYIYKDISILESRVNSEIVTKKIISGATVKNGIIYGGINDHEPLFLWNK